MANPGVEYVTLPADSSSKQVKDIVSLFEQEIKWYGMVVALQVTFFNFIFALFILALDKSLEDQGWGSIIRLQVSEGTITCKSGVPTTWKIGGVSLMVAFAAFELHVARQTSMGKQLLQNNKFTVFAAGALTFLDRYDNFGDISFALAADACGSELGLYSLVNFGVGVIFAQMLYALYLLFYERATHLALRFNGLLLFLELIDPQRPDLRLPESTQAQALGELTGGEQLAPSMQAPAQVPTQNRPGASNETYEKSDEEIARIKSQIEFLSAEEEARIEQDPDSVKNAVFVAQSKKLVGAIRFFAENLPQSYFQVKFLMDFWDDISWNTRIFTITSIVAGFLVALGGPMYARYAEYKNAKYYNNLPKLQNGITFKGVTREDWEYEGLVHPTWSTVTLTFNSLEKTQDRIKISGKLVTQEILRECNENASEALRRKVNRMHVHRTDAGCEAILEGEYDVNHTMMTLQTRQMTALSPGAVWEYETFNLKLYADCIKGYAEIIPDRPNLVTFDRGTGGSIEIPKEAAYAPGETQKRFFTLKRVEEVDGPSLP